MSGPSLSTPEVRAVDTAISRLVEAHLDGHVTDGEYRRQARVLGWSWWHAVGWEWVAR